MPTNHPTIPPPASPRCNTFDPWNTSSTGHQHAANRLSGSTSWRQSRTTKLANQLRSGAGGGKRMFDSVGAGGRDFGRDGRKESGGWEHNAPGLRKKGCQTVSSLLKPYSQLTSPPEDRQAKRRKRDIEDEVIPSIPTDPENFLPSSKPAKKIFDGLRIYINGSTAPKISDHRLKFLLAEHGAGVSIALGRRSVSHVILGTPNGNRVKGAGGGLAGGKIEKEIRRVGGCGVKYVGVEWVLESIEAGKRLPEARFSNLSTAPMGVKSVYGMFQKLESSDTAPKEVNG